VTEVLRRAAQRYLHPWYPAESVRRSADHRSSACCFPKRAQMCSSRFAVQPWNLLLHLRETAGIPCPRALLRPQPDLVSSTSVASSELGYRSWLARMLVMLAHLCARKPDPESSSLQGHTYRRVPFAGDRASRPVPISSARAFRSGSRPPRQPAAATDAPRSDCRRSCRSAPCHWRRHGRGCAGSRDR
jgi:hypothetical protein